MGGGGYPPIPLRKIPLKSKYFNMKYETFHWFLLPLLPSGVCDWNSGYNNPGPNPQVWLHLSFFKWCWRVNWKSPSLLLPDHDDQVVITVIITTWSLSNNDQHTEVLNGALVGGPDHNDNYVDDRTNFQVESFVSKWILHWTDITLGPKKTNFFIQ